jgi:hypothetical protein
VTGCKAAAVAVQFALVRCLAPVHSACCNKQLHQPWKIYNSNGSTAFNSPGIFNTCSISASFPTQPQTASRYHTVQQGTYPLAKRTPPAPPPPAPTTIHSLHHVITQSKSAQAPPGGCTRAPQRTPEPTPLHPPPAAPGVGGRQTRCPASSACQTPQCWLGLPPPGRRRTREGCHPCCAAPPPSRTRRWEPADRAAYE